MEDRLLVRPVKLGPCTFDHSRRVCASSAAGHDHPSATLAGSCSVELTESESWGRTPFSTRQVIMEPESGWIERTRVRVEGGAGERDSGAEKIFTERREHTYRVVVSWSHEDLQSLLSPNPLVTHRGFGVVRSSCRPGGGEMHVLHRNALWMRGRRRRSGWLRASAADDVVWEREREAAPDSVVRNQ